MEHATASHRPGQPTTPREILLDSGHATEHEHRAQAAQPHAEHHEQERPAAPDAERAMGDPHRQRLATLRGSAPPIEDEAERAPAGIQAAVSERTELP